MRYVSIGDLGIHECTFGGKILDINEGESM